MINTHKKMQECIQIVNHHSNCEKQGKLPELLHLGKYLHVAHKSYAQQNSK